MKKGINANWLKILTIIKFNDNTIWAHYEVKELILYYWIMNAKESSYPRNSTNSIPNNP